MNNLKRIKKKQLDQWSEKAPVTVKFFNERITDLKLSFQPRKFPRHWRDVMNLDHSNACAFAQRIRSLPTAFVAWRIEFCETKKINAREIHFISFRTSVKIRSLPRYQECVAEARYFYVTPWTGLITSILEIF